MNPKIAIGCPVRNRAWVMPEYLAALEAIDCPNKVYLFLENDSTDESLQTLKQFPFSSPMVVRMHNTGNADWDRGDYSVNHYANLAAVRNAFIDFFLEGSSGPVEWKNADYLFSVDSDVIVPPEALQRLVEFADENTIVGAAISNIPGQPLDGSTPGNFMVKHQCLLMHPKPYPLAGIMDVDVIGAVYLIPRKALEDGVRYAPNSQGEDIPFCQQAQEKGYRLRVVLDLVCDHRMIRKE